MYITKHLILRHAIVDEAVTWLNTPYQHQGRINANNRFTGGVDCGGLIIAIGNSLVLWHEPNFNYHAYGHDIPEDLLLTLFDQFLIHKTHAKAGDILLFLIGQKIQHAGILTFANTLIHVCNRAGKVIETDCTSTLWQRVMGVYQYPRFNLSHYL